MGNDSWPKVLFPASPGQPISGLAVLILWALLFCVSAAAHGQQIDGALDSPRAVQRQILHVKEIQRELARALKARVQSTDELLLELGQEVRQLTEQDVDIAMLRDAWLDVETRQARLESVETRIARREEKLRRLEKVIADRSGRPPESGAVLRLADVVAQVALRKERELRAAMSELLQTLRALRAVTVQRLDIAEERLALLQSLIRHGTGTDPRVLSRDPRVQLIERVIATLSRDALRLLNVMEYISETPDEVAR